MASEKKQIASRINGSKSRGPTSGAGRAVASRNSLDHGILSRELVLPSERREDFDALLGRLIEELGAVGTLECILVERIAIAMWRQRRLVRAESARIQLQQSNQQNPAFARMPNRFRPDTDLHAEVVANLARDGKLDEFERELNEAALIETLDAEELRSRFPILLDMLRQNQAGQDGKVTRSTLFAMAEGMRDAALVAIGDYRQGRVLQTLRTESLAIPDTTDTLARYQSALDNELYKALRALREAQAARRRQIDVAAPGAGEASA